MPAAKVDLYIEQGSTFEHKFTWKDGNGDPIDLTGYAAKMQIREKKGAVDVLLELSTSNSMITLGGTAGTIELVISATDTAAITWKKAVYDLELVSATNKVTRLTEGNVTVSFEVTK